VEANGRVYRIVSRDDARGKGDARKAAPAAGALEFCEPSGELEALGLLEGAARRAAAAGDPRRAPAGRDALPGGADWPVDKFLQTPWTASANGNGFASAGPSYFGAGYHQGLNNAYRSNDYYALDFGFQNAAEILPNGPGTVLYAGWAGGGWSPYGRVVIVDMGDGYWSLAAHLARIDVAAGDEVDDATVVGLAGGSGNFRDGLWSCHLHNALYRNATLDWSAGGIYGGQSVRPRAVRFFRNGGGAYDTIQAGQTLSW
jgi:murein DD-endopeptidase MepM/ murein hydrolase activator NlpD